MRYVPPGGHRVQVQPSDLDRVQARRLRRAARRARARQNRRTPPRKPEVTEGPREEGASTVEEMVAEALRRQTQATTVGLSFAAALGKALRREDDVRPDSDVHGGR